MCVTISYYVILIKNDPINDVGIDGQFLKLAKNVVIQNPITNCFSSIKPFKPHVLALDESMGSVGTFPMCKLIWQ